MYVITYIYLRPEQGLPKPAPCFTSSLLGGVNRCAVPLLWITNREGRNRRDCQGLSAVRRKRSAAFTRVSACARRDRHIEPKSGCTWSTPCRVEERQPWAWIPSPAFSISGGTDKILPASNRYELFDRIVVVLEDLVAAPSPPAITCAVFVH